MKSSFEVEIRFETHALPRNPYLSTASALSVPMRGFLLQRLGWPLQLLHKIPWPRSQSLGAVPRTWLAENGQLPLIHKAEKYLGVEL
jgi:hypothetical protein